MDGIFVSIFLGFWSILGGKLGGKPEPRSTQKGIEKRCKKEEQRGCQKSRNKNLQPRAGERVLGPGEGVGGGVNPYPREEGKGMRPVQRPKPPQPRGLVGLTNEFIRGVLGPHVPHLMTARSERMRATSGKSFYVAPFYKN